MSEDMPIDSTTPEQSDVDASGEVAAPSETTITADHVLEALKVVVDPELGINIVDLGLVYDVAIDADSIKVTYTLTSMGCPVGPMIDQQIRTILTTIPGKTDITSEVTFNPPWSPELMSEEARLAMGMF